MVYGEQSVVPDKRNAFFKTLVRHPLAREGVFAQGGRVFLTIAMGRLINIVGLWPYGQHGRHCLEIIQLMTVRNRQGNN